MVTLYTTNCPKCKVLEKKLEEKNIKFEICDNVDIMLEKGMMQTPYLEIDNKLLDFSKAIKWINEK